MLSQVDEARRVPAPTGEKVFVNPQHPRTGPIRQLTAAQPILTLIPPFHRCRTDVMGARNLALSDATVVGFEHFSRRNASEALNRGLTPWKRWEKYRPHCAQ